MSQSKDSRTSKSITNAKVALFFMLATFAVNFISRRYFLDGLGPEIMGMRTIIGTIISMLSLSELGIGASIGSHLYKPIHEKNYEEINEIISLQGWLYKWVFGILTVGMAIVLTLVPSLFAKTQAPILYVYLTLAIFYFGTMCSYTINYKIIILGADQKWYKVSKILSTATLVKTIIQVIILKYIHNSPYLYWLLVDFIGTMFAVLVQDYVTKREYPWLKVNTKLGYQYFKKYPQILKNTGQIFIHSIASFIVSNLTPYVIFMIASLTTVNLYDNYKNLVTNIRAVVYSIFTNMSNGIGSLVAEGNAEQSYRFFWEMISLKYLISSIVAFGLLNYSSLVINLWLGDKYIIDFFSLLIISLIAYIDICGGTVGSYINNGYKLFQDVWAPVVEGIVFIIFAILGGKFFGFTGTLLGSLVSQIVIIVLWKPYNLFHNGFKRSVWDYWKGVIKLPLIAWTAIALFTLGIRSLNLDFSSWTKLILHALWLTSIFAIVVGGIYYLLSAGFRRMTLRLYRLVYQAAPSVIQNYLPKA